jgi:hypothetical protein
MGRLRLVLGGVMRPGGSVAVGGTVGFGGCGLLGALHATTKQTKSQKNGRMGYFMQFGF